MDAFKINEKQFIIEFIQLYKRFPCLWDTKDAEYNNKDARSIAHNVLLEKYKQYDSSADLRKVRTKILNLRSSLRREYNKVLRSKFKGSIHKPMLWYYELMSFITDGQTEVERSDETRDDSDTDRSVNDDNSNNRVLHEEIVIKMDPDEPPAKVSRESELYKEVLRPISKDPLSFEQVNDQEHSNEATPSPDTATPSCPVTIPFQAVTAPLEAVRTPTYAVTSPCHLSEESDAFCHTIGLQLRELDNFQRVVAQKLISDVIFAARLKKLRAESTINH